MNVLILMAKSSQMGELQHPVSFVEIAHKSVLERVCDEVKTLDEISSLNIYFIVRNAEVEEFGLDKVIRMVIPTANVIATHGDTKGACCTAMLAPDKVFEGDELLILNGDEYLDVNLGSLVEKFRKDKVDGGVVVFETINPIYSFVKMNEIGEVREVAEKRPISRYGTVGFYYFRTGEMFYESAKSMIRKGGATKGNYFVAPVFNELILKNKNVMGQKIAAEAYHPFKNILQIKGEKT